MFFDGECGLCNRFVRWLLARDRKRILSLSPLQGDLASRVLPSTTIELDGESVAFWDETGVYRESDAALRAVARVGGVWRLAGLALVVPRPLRDAAYRYVAQNRFRWFGRVESCALMSPDDRSRLLP